MLRILLEVYEKIKANLSKSRQLQSQVAEVISKRVGHDRKPTNNHKEPSLKKIKTLPNANDDSPASDYCVIILVVKICC